jgi:hypothetical protein
VLGDERSCHVTEAHTGVHGVRSEQSPGKCAFSIVGEKTSRFLEEYGNTLLVPVRTGGTDRKHSERLGAPVESGNEMPVNFVGGESLGFVGTEKPIRNEDRAFTDGRIRDQMRIDANGDVKAYVLGVVQHQIAQVEPLRGGGGDRLRLVLSRRIREDLVCGIEPRLVRSIVEALPPRPKEPSRHGPNLLGSPERLEQEELRLDLLESLEIELSRLG